MPRKSSTKKKKNSNTKKSTSTTTNKTNQSKSKSKSKLTSNSNTNNPEIQESKSPAEFFAENQAIAGFDNYGRSLYTTIRELVENSLDACESVNVLPSIGIKIEDMSQVQFNQLRGVDNGSGNGSGNGNGNGDKGSSDENQINDSKITTPFKSDDNSKLTSKATSKPSSVSPSKTTSPSPTNKRKRRSKIEETYFRISVRDNGCGMEHDAIPDLLGRVLSGSKYGVRQTRGKFGLGAKMALIWSKKSTGVPIQIKTAHMILKNEQNENNNEKKNKHDYDHDLPPPPFVSTCTLDIDIYKNEPRVIEHTKYNNKEDWKGTEFTVLIAGNWTTYKSRIVQYLQQLAIITPYAKFEMHYLNLNDAKKEMKIRYDRRSEQMPAPAREVKHHPRGVNNLLIQQLLVKTKSKSLLKFLCNDLSGVSTLIAKRVIAELGTNFSDNTKPCELLDGNGNTILHLVQILRNSEIQFKPPDGSCLSPLGEYNLNLGIRKVIEPDVVATARDKAYANEGNPFIVEAAISLGGKSAKEGLNIVRFANRIPLLFEAGSDVVTRVSQNKIKWSSYKIDQKRDKIGIFVSIVSTKIPFKGTGKEYIGDDITEIHQSVKRAMQSCCQQLRSHLTKRNAIRDANQRRSRLTKYIPDVTRSLVGILDNMKKRKADNLDNSEQEIMVPPRQLSRKRARKIDEITESKNRKEVLEMIENEVINEDIIRSSLFEAIDLQGNFSEGVTSSSGAVKDKASSELTDFAQPVFLVPFINNIDPAITIEHPLFTFRPMTKIKSEYRI